MDLQVPAGLTHWPKFHMKQIPRLHVADLGLDFCSLEPGVLGFSCEGLDLGWELKKAAYAFLSSPVVRNGSASRHLSLFCSKT